MKYIQYTLFLLLLLLVEHEYHELQLPLPKIEMFKTLIIKKGQQPIDRLSFLLCIHSKQRRESGSCWNRIWVFTKWSVSF
jgi:hypothetical protein